MEATIEKTQEKTLVHKGIVNKISALNSQYGHSWRIEMDHGSSYYLNGKTENLASKLFTVGQKAVFSTKDKPNKHGQVYKIIEHVFETF